MPARIAKHETVRHARNLLVFESPGFGVILVSPGKKGAHDFRVRYRPVGRGRRLRTPKHIHLVVDLFAKRATSPVETGLLVREHLDFIRRSVPATSFPPVEPLSFTEEVRRVASRFAGLNGSGEYPVDFLVATLRLIQIQEKTNYPSGTVSEDLYGSFADGSDIFSIVGLATWRGPS